jgi:hypothetical protein
LERERVAKLREIATLIARDLGYGSFDILADRERLDVQQEAEDAINKWEQAVELELSPPEPKGPLQVLLREYHDICEAILDEDDMYG